MNINLSFSHCCKDSDFFTKTSMRLKRQAALNDWREKKDTSARCTGCSCLNSGK